MVVNIPIPIPPVTGRQASINILTVYFRPEGVAAGNAQPITTVTRWKQPLSLMDAKMGRVAQTPGLWHPAHDLVEGPDGRIYGADFAPEDH